ncbi:hypothetical protein FIBSPDRAFT_936410 [Athelia psychrophila]|uniref:Uncharacterized protein n=1 Tax=Athelia psychrophila TaxID=1759441 RepID=A0A166C7G5_9AGAM|nr:hypothetical protein FIBSPDRAFT_936410 [Fibularhizoctonia sp. CBS 109695]
MPFSASQDDLRYGTSKQSNNYGQNIYDQADRGNINHGQINYGGPTTSTTHYHGPIHNHNYGPTYHCVPVPVSAPSSPSSHTMDSPGQDSGSSMAGSRRRRDEPDVASREQPIEDGLVHRAADPPSINKFITKVKYILDIIFGSRQAAQDSSVASVKQ